MQPLLSDAQRALLAKAERLAADFATRAEQHDRDGSFPHENFAALHAAGWLRLPLPVELGGGGLTLYDFCLLQEALGRGCGPTALGVNMHAYNLGGGLHLFTEAFRRRVADAVVRDGAVVASSLSEPAASLGAPQVTAHKVAGGYRVSGRKYFCTLAPVLRFFLFNARLEGFAQPGLSGTVTLAAERGSVGMQVVESWDALGMRASGSHDIDFADCFIPDECLIGTEGAGSEGGMVCLPWYALGIAAVYTGVAGAAFDFTVDYLRQRRLHPLPATVAHLPGAQFDVAEMQIQLETARALIYKTAAEITRGADFGAALLPAVATPQYVATRAALDVVARAMQVVGGPSLFRRLPLERWYRDVRAGTLHPFTHSWLLEMIGKTALGIPLDVQPRWV
ncbi:MAG: acyl-CoA dehydrogenase family protein [Deltaproteobacteria bacterium]|nr:acyl-CoA dehydrogenase family protein [Deltaproteobacteria bacterium]